MSGRNQHFIPRMLLRGFRSRGDEARTYVWVARREGGVFEPNIIGVAAQNDFYSAPSSDGRPTLDDAITHYEDRLGALLMGLRRLDFGETAPAEDASEVVSHLTRRVPGFRHFMGDTVSDLFQRASDHFSRPEVIRGLAGLEGPEPTEVFRDRALPEIRANPRRAHMQNVPDDMLVAMAYAQAREGYDVLFAPQAALVEDALRTLIAQAPAQAAEGHRRILAEDLAGQARVDFLDGYRWRIEAAPEGGCILPDCVALGVTGAGELRPFMLCDRTDTAGVAFPLAADRLLVAAPPDGDWPNLADFNAAAAAASDHFFVAHVRRPDMEALKGRIGVITAPFRADLVDKVMREFEGRQPTAPARVAPPTEPPRLCEVEASFGDPEYSARAIARTQALIARLSPHLALDRLLGVTFASVPQMALISLDRGDPRLPRYTLDMLPQDLGAASPIIVRDGQLYSKTFIDSDIGWALADDDEPDDVPTALHVIAHQLAEVSAARRIDQALPGFVLESSDDLHTHRLAMPAMLAAFAFHAALQSAGFGSEAKFEARYREALIDAIERAPTVLGPIIETLSPGDDLEAYYVAALACASGILVAAAHLAGHRTGLDQDPLADDSDLQDRLAKVGLSGWFPVFNADLSDFWDTPGSWRSRAPFLALHRHTERILWALNLFPKRMDDGGTWLVAPDVFQPSDS
jgi:hypothetical protein